jgi:hypothetical protein
MCEGQGVSLSQTTVYPGAPIFIRRIPVRLRWQEAKDLLNAYSAHFTAAANLEALEGVEWKNERAVFRYLGTLGLADTKVPALRTDESMNELLLLGDTLFDLRAAALEDGDINTARDYHTQLVHDRKGRGGFIMSDSTNYWKPRDQQTPCTSNLSDIDHNMQGVVRNIIKLLLNNGKQRCAPTAKGHDYIRFDGRLDWVLSDEDVKRINAAIASVRLPSSDGRDTKLVSYLQDCRKPNLNESFIFVRGICQWILKLSRSISAEVKRVLNDIVTLMWLAKEKKVRSEGLQTAQQIMAITLTKAEMILPLSFCTSVRHQLLHVSIYTK